MSKPLKKGGKLKSQKALKASKKRITGTSKKVADYDEQFALIRPTILERDNNRCVAQIPNCCWNLAIHVHHKKLRSQGGTNLPSNLISLCLACHEFIHSNPDWSKERGFLH